MFVDREKKKKSVCFWRNFFQIMTIIIIIINITRRKEKHFRK